MSALVTIGDFSRMTYLSVKALRHYHEIGLLEPADIDGDSGYRRYHTRQVTTAQVIRRFRDLGMALEQIKAVLAAPDLQTRNRIVVEHLGRMEAELEHTEVAVASLRTLLDRPPAQISVEHRTIDATHAVGIRQLVSAEDVGRWWSEAFAELDNALGAGGIEPTGPAGALYFGDYFAAGRGEIVAFIPVAADIGRLPDAGRARALTLAGVEVAVALHRGAFSELDQTYGALGTVVAEQAIGIDGPIREHYLVSSRDTHDEVRHRTEVCWPIFRTATRPHPGHRTS